MKIPGIFKDFHLRAGSSAKAKTDAEQEQATEGIDLEEPAPLVVTGPAAPAAQTKPDVKASEQDNQITSREPDDVESLWFALLDDPNNEKNLNRLIRFCQTRKGPASVNAALAELSLEDGSYLPQLILASMALERKEPDEAIRHYNGLLAGGSTGDYALLRMSADMGRNGYPAEMIAIVGPFYNPEKHNEYIGLNLLQAYKETGDINSGKALFDRLKALNRAKIAPGLQSFERVFSSGEARKVNKEIPVPAPAVKPSQSEEKPAAVEIPIIPPQAQIADEETVAPSSAGFPARAKLMQIPIWKKWIPELADLLPKTESGPRVGLYLYADTSPRDMAGVGSGSSISPSQLATAVPMSVAEQLLFTSPVVPMVLFPVSFAKGPDMGSAEPDVQSLFSLCSKESLDFLITGTVCRSHDGYMIRTWLIDKTKKSARIISKDISSGDFGQGVSGHVEEMVSLFRDKNYAFEVKRLGITYSFPSGALYETQLIALERLARRALVDEGVCSVDILSDPGAFLETLASLYTGKPLSQNYLMMLLAGMISDKDRGSESYLKYRDLLYDGAHKMQYTPCVTASRKELDKILKG
jgi:hypothetical protein